MHHSHALISALNAKGGNGSLTAAAMYQVGSNMINGSLSVFISSDAFMTKANSALLTE